ncbi:SNF2 family N-terminal domain-containing protein [Gongronella butleri]|nr:SNF2 family N-terminal domain-containing protein [Gongronella butleri]
MPRGHDVIPGATVNLSVIEKWQESMLSSADAPEQETKRRRTDGPTCIGYLDLPLPSTVSSAHAHALAQMKLEPKWTYYVQDDLQVGSLCLAFLDDPVVLVDLVYAEHSTPEQDGPWIRFFMALAAARANQNLSILQHTVKSASATAPITLSVPIALPFDKPMSITFFFRVILPHWYPQQQNHAQNASTASIDDFYSHIQPPISPVCIQKCAAPQLVAKLTPFQSQNVEWMVEREGYNILDDGTLQPLPRYNGLPFLWEKLDLPKGASIYVNRLQQQLHTTWTHELDELAQQHYHGGILADEMGLGKTVSVIALILLHSAANSPVYQDLQYTGYSKAKSTLVITPSSIIHQWEKEIKMHAPSLSVFIYHGIKSLGKDMDTVAYGAVLAEYDVVLTTYDVLKTEVYYARTPPDRSRRHGVKYEIRKSPLVQYVWWRCVLDEAQRVDSPVSLTAEMANLVPRVFSWGVTGTPIKSTNLDDLYGLYKFIDVMYTLPLKLFRRLHHDPEHHETFWTLTKATMRRNWKSMLADQVHIPPQHRRTIHIDFSAIEQHYYNDLWAACTGENDIPWLDSLQWTRPTEPADLVTRYDDTITRLRRWLTLLRETCVHATVTAGRARQENVRTLEQVLELMMQGTSEKMDELRIMIAQNQLQQGGMHELLEEWTDSLEVYMEGAAKMAERVQDFTDRLQHLEVTHDATNDTNDKTESDKQRKLISGRASAQHMLHRFYFYIAGIYLMMEDKTNEELYYDKAADVRRQILVRPRERVESAIQEIKGASVDTSDKKVGFSQQKETLLLTEDFLERVDDLAELLDNQLIFMETCRKQLMAFLTAKLVDTGDADDDVKGDEYEDSLVTQEKCDIYQDIYQDALRDRHFWLTGMWTVPRAANAAEETQQDEEQMTDEQKELQALRKELEKTRKEFMPTIKSDNLRGLIAELRTKMYDMNTTQIEGQLMQAEATRLNSALKQQRELLENLETESRKLSSLSNSRIEYYRALQHISDQVVTWKHDRPRRVLAVMKVRMEDLRAQLEEQATRWRYLDHLAKEQQEQASTGNKEENKDMFCLICKDYVTKGIVTYCGHMYCDVCAIQWFRTSERCPQCSATVRRGQWYKVSLNLATLQGTEKGNQQDEGAPGPADKTSISAEVLNEINRVQIHEGQGGKLDSIIRHIKYLQLAGRGKCLVFSQWTRVLELIGTGLSRNDIGFVKFSGKRDDRDIVKFREDPSVHVMLLHGRSQSSGLTLLEAKTVFIVEPILNEALEKQAISRVHRIGQTEQTSVFWYIVRDTIEERVQAIHDTKQRTWHLEHADMEITPEPARMQKNAAGGGEYVDDDDVRRCFTQLD